MAETKDRALLWKCLAYLRREHYALSNGMRGDEYDAQALIQELEAHLEPHKKKP